MLPLLLALLPLLLPCCPCCALLPRQAEGLIQQLLLALNHLLQLAHHLLPLLHLAVLRRLQVLQKLLQLRQHLLRRFTRARAHHLADCIQHLLQVLPLDLNGVGIERHLGLLVGHLLRLLHHRLEELVESPLQFGHEPLQLLVARALLERLAQGVLELAQFALGERQAAILEVQRRVPQQIEDVVQGSVLLALRRGRALLSLFSLLVLPRPARSGRSARRAVPAQVAVRGFARGVRRARPRQFGTCSNSGLARDRASSSSRATAELRAR